MNSKRTYFIMLGFTALLVLVLLGGTYGFNSLLEKQSKQLLDLKVKDQALAQSQIDLNKAKKEIRKYAELKQITKAIVPQDKDQAQAVREIVRIASDSGVQLSTISFPASTLGGAAGGSAPKASSASGAKIPLSQVEPVPTIPGVYKLEINLQNKEDTAVTFDQFYNFLTKLENNRRTAQVSSISIQPTTSNRSLLTFKLTLEEYIKP